MLIAIGLLLALVQPVEVRDVLAVGHRIAGQPLFLVVAVLLMAALFTFGLPGSLCLWLIAPFYPPLVATGLLVAGSVIGALGAYFLIAVLGRDWKPRGISLRLTLLLARHRDFFTQCAFRILPGFPHSAINFAGGLLALPLVQFVSAATLGLAVKWGVYASAVHGITETLEPDTTLGVAALWPLMILTMLLLIGAWARRWISRS